MPDGAARIRPGDTAQQLHALCDPVRHRRRRENVGHARAVLGQVEQQRLDALHDLERLHVLADRMARPDAGAAFSTLIIFSSNGWPGWCVKARQARIRPRSCPAKAR